LLSGGTLGKKLSYYVYFLLAERGDVAGVEDAFIYWNDIGGAPVDLAVGQFQVSDPIFKRELRLEVLDYAIYKVLVGLQPANLTYDRGLMASAGLAGFTLTASLLNGDGIPAANELFRYDNDANKNLFGHLTRNFGSHARLGLMGYTGRQNGDAYGFPDQSNAISMWGADATFGTGAFQLNLQYIARTDTEADFVPGEPTVSTDGGFAEVLVRPAGSRWYGYGLYNYIEASQPVLNVNMGVPVDVDQYESIAVGGGYLVYRNFRLYGEYGYDFNNELNRLTAGFTTAF
jgi:predicted porin